MMTAFLYRWINKDTKEYYIGVHEGEEDDGYIASSSSFLNKYNAAKTRWDRVIVSKHKSMATALKAESEMVTANTLKDPLCLNRMVGGEPTFTALELKMATLSSLYHQQDLGSTGCKEAFNKLWGHYPNKHWSPNPWTETTLYALACSLTRYITKEE
jgi:hypothetical protein